MILPQTYAATMFLLLLSMLCMGVWVSTLKLAGKWRFELFYMDFAFGVLIAALIYAFTVGNLGFDGFTLIDDLQHAGKHQWLYCLLSGMIFNLGNLLLVAAVSVAGMVLAFPAAMAIALVLSTVLGFAATKPGTGLILLLGCGFLLTSVVLDAMGYRLLSMQHHEMLARAGKAKSTRRPAALKGIVLSVAGGLLLGSFTPLLDKARQGEQGLGPYAAGALFAIGMFCSTFVFTIFFINLPVEGEPAEISSYFTERLRQHVWGFIGGLVWCTASIAGLVAAAAPDNAQVDLSLRAAIIQAAPLLTALIGIVIWKELRYSDVRVKSLTVLMAVLYACGVVMVSAGPFLAGKP